MKKFKRSKLIKFVSVTLAVAIVCGSVIGYNRFKSSACDEVNVDEQRDIQQVVEDTTGFSLYEENNELTEEGRLCLEYSDFDANSFQYIVDENLKEKISEFTYQEYISNLTLSNEILSDIKNNYNGYELNNILESGIVTPKDELDGKTYITRKAGTTGVSIHSWGLTIKMSKKDINTALKVGTAVASVYVPYRFLKGVLAVLNATNLNTVKHGVQFDINFNAFKRNLQLQIPVMIINPMLAMNPALWVGVSVAAATNVRWQ